MRKNWVITFLLSIYIISACRDQAAYQNNSHLDDKVVEEKTKDKYLYTNDLVYESSPYLLEHAHNPVDWKPWGDAAFAAAKKKNALIILSIGYSTCIGAMSWKKNLFKTKA